MSHVEIWERWYVQRPCGRAAVPMEPELAELAGGEGEDWRTERSRKLR